MATSMFIIVFIIVCSVSWSHAITNATASETGVQIIGTGKFDIILSGKLIFTVPSSCQGFFSTCYETTGSPEERYDYDNAGGVCDQDRCLLDFNPHEPLRAGLLTVSTDNHMITAMFNATSKHYCPMKTLNGRMTFNVVSMPSCSVNVVGASLPSEKTQGDKSGKIESETKTASTPSASSNPGQANFDYLYWLIPLCVVIVASLLVIGALSVIFKFSWPCKKSDAQVAPQPAQADPEQPKAPAKSPLPIAAPPMAIPTVAPVATVISMPSLTVAMPPITDAVSPSVITPPPRTVLSQGERVKKEKKPRPSAVTPVHKSATKTSTAKSISPPFEPVLKYREDPLRYMRRVPTAIHSSRSGSDIGPLIESAYAIYAPFAEPRIVVEWEVNFFLQIVSDAMKDIDGLLKSARQELCRHGAIFSHRRLCSFSKVTYRYIRRRETPGFIAWYAFACEHGGWLKVPDDKDGDAALNDMTVPTLLMVFFREDIEIEVRRKAYARLRRIQVQLVSMHPLNELKGSFYPVCLIPAMLKKNRRLFLEGADDRTYSTPYEMFHQLHQYRASRTDEGIDEEIDETQVTFSDGKKRDVIGSVEVLGTQLTPSTTIHEDLF